MKKVYLSAAIAAFFCLQVPVLNAQEMCSAIFTEGEGMPQSTAISNNGRYIVGVDGQFTGFIWDTETGQYDLILRKNGSEGSDSKQISIWDVRDDGTAIGSHEDKPATYKNGEWTILPLPKGFRGGEAIGSSNDGTLLCGYVSDGSGKPCIWKNGEITMLESILDDKEKTPQFIHAEHMSGDGSVITGFIRTNQGFYIIGVIWRAPEYKCEALFLDSLATKGGDWKNYSITAISDNGKWIAGGIAKYEDEESELSITRPYRYNMETGELDIIKDMEVVSLIGDGGASAISNEGDLFASNPLEANNPYATHSHISQIDKAPIEIGEYISDTYGYDEVMKTLEFTGYVMSVTPDGKTWAGFGAGVDEDLNFVYNAYKVDIRPANIATADKDEKAFSCYVNNRTLYFKGEPKQVEIVNVEGALVQSATVNGNTSVSLAGLPEGIYMVKLSDGNVTNVQKIAVK